MLDTGVAGDAEPYPALVSMATFGPIDGLAARRAHPVAGDSRDRE